MLSNSSFAAFDYFNAPTVTLSLAPSTPNRSPLSSRASTPTLLPSFREMSAAAFDDIAEEVELGSPTAKPYVPLVLSSPTAESRRQSAARRSVQIHEKSAVNWARPLRAEKESNVTMRIFGASSQRNRRLKGQSSTPHLTPIPSPSSSSDEEPVTPSLTPTLPTSVSLGWSTSGARGLGMPGVAEWDSSPLPSDRKDYFQSTFESSSSSSDRYSLTSEDSFSSGIGIAAHASPTPKTSRLLSSSQSLNSFASPSTLDELRYLRQAALDLEVEARRPIVSSPSRPKERRIKRKAVPVLDVLPTATISPISSSSSSPFLLPVDEPKVFESPTSQLPFPRQRTGNSFYQNRLATMSVIEVSPRVGSLPFVIPPRLGSSRLNQSQFGIDSDCSSSSASGSPSTPTSKGKLDAFLIQMDAGLQMLQLDKDKDKEKKHKRGLSRFLTPRRSAEV